MTDCVDKDLFGQPIILKPKKKKAAASPVQLPKAAGISWGSVCKRWLKRFTGDTAHQTAVNVAATLLAGAVLAGLAGMAQWKWDWIGWSRGEIGEWITTIEPEE